MDPWNLYERRGTLEARPYVPGEDLGSISVGVDVPTEGDMIARNPNNTADQWLVSAAFFAKNYKLCG